MLSSRPHALGIPADIASLIHRYHPPICWKSNANTLSCPTPGETSSFAKASEDRPNIVFIFADDWGNINYLKENGVKIWDEWADEKGDLGRIYGAQWTSWRIPEGGEIHQINQVIDQIKTNPDSRRHIVSAWNPDELHLMALPPCHALFQFYVDEDKLSCQLYQRSADLFLGVPFNIASYALLTMMIAQVCGLEPGEFIHTFGDLHLYKNHMEQARLQLSRVPRSLPVMKLNPEIRDILAFQYQDFVLEGYDPHPGIKVSISV